MLAAAAAAAGGPTGGEVNHVVESVRRAEPGPTALLAIPRALQATRLSAAGILCVDTDMMQ